MNPISYNDQSNVYTNNSQINYASSSQTAENNNDNSSVNSTKLGEVTDSSSKNANGIIQTDVTKAYDEKTLKRMGVVECSTCASRKYQDGSNDPGVSFKSPTHVSTSASYSAVRGHEQEHVVREKANAKENNGEVVSQSVTIHSSICPECGKVYTSGGVTSTTVRYSNETENDYKGKMVDMLL